MKSLDKARLSVARGLIKATLRANRHPLCHYASKDIDKAAQILIAADPTGIDAEVARGMGQLWSPNGL